MTNELLVKFESDFRDYTEACIAFAVAQEEYKPLSFERDLEWIKNWMRDNLMK
jgi:hypothetical protein